VVLTVSVAVTAVAPVIGGGAVTEHVGESAAPVGPPVTAQLRDKLPVKPPLGLIEMVDVPLDPGVGMVTAVLLREKPGGVAGTLMVRLVVALVLPAEAPVAFTVYEPGVVASSVLRVSVAVTGEPVTETAEGMEQVGGLTAAVGPPVTVQLSVTCPV
jgi:hypothetical protein